MKLNLVPANVSKSGGSSMGAIIAAVLLGLLGILIAAGMIFMSNKQLADAKAEAQSKAQAAADAQATSLAAIEQINKATIIDRNVKLADAMTQHNYKYVDLYNDVMSYIPSYYRITNLNANPSTPETTTVTMVGQLKDFSQYADLAIALWKIDGAVDVQRAGYVVNDPSVPALTEADQIGTPLKPGETPLPSTWEERMNALIGRAASEPGGFLGAGGFGSTDNLTARGPMPGWSTVTMTVTLTRAMQTPDPRTTIFSGGGPAAGAPPVAGFGQPVGGR